MTDSLKFGPEWLRNLSQDGCVQSGASTTPRYQLAEHRYGREEMLALFDRLVKAPDTLTTMPALYVEKTQTPLALVQMTEEETRMWNRGINSDAVVRLNTMKTAPTGVPGGVRGGRGGSVDRGRGRGRGGYHYSRGLSYEEPGEGSDLRGGRGVSDRGDGGGSSSSISFPRSVRPYDRPQGPAVERNWGDRNGVDPSDWNGSTSPRKDYSGRGYMAENWRRHRVGEDEDGWRTASNNRTEKWGRPNSWRDGEKEGNDDRGGRSWEKSRNWNENPSATHNSNRRPWEEDRLPEWAMENPSESGGSFDASGAFHGGGGFSDDEDGGLMGRGQREPRTRLLSEGNSSKKPQSQPGRRVGGLSQDAGMTHSVEDHPRRNDSLGTEFSKTSSVSSHISTSASYKNTPLSELDKNKTVNAPTQPSKSDSGDKVINDTVPSKPPVPSSTPSEVPPPEASSGRVSSTTNNAVPQRPRKPSPEANLIVPDNTATCVSDSADNMYPNMREPVEKLQMRQQAHESVEKLQMRQQAHEPVEKLQMRQPAHESVEKLQIHQQTHESVEKLQMRQQAHKPVEKLQMHQQSNKPVGRQKSEDDMERLQEEDWLVKLMDDEESPEKASARLAGLGSTPVLPPMADKWFYRDPQGEVQGPFTAAEMAEWFRLGYFTLTLLVRRGCDDRYCQLGDLMKSWGRIPFLPGPSMPPLKSADTVVTSTQNMVQPNPAQAMPGGMPQDGLLMHQYQYMLQRQMQLRHDVLDPVSGFRQAAAVQAVVGKLSQTEQWNTLSPLEQHQLIMQQVAQQPPIDTSMGPFAAPQKNPVLHLLSQMQQQPKVPAAPVVPDTSKLPPSAVPNPPLDPLQQLIRDMGGLQQTLPTTTPFGMGPPPTAPPISMASMMHPAAAGPAAPPPPPPADKVEDPIQNLLRQLGNKVVKQPVDSVWGGPIASTPSTFSAQSWLQQMAPVPAPQAPPGQLPSSLWDLHGKDIKTEQQILEEQMRAEEERRREEQRKKEEVEKQRKALEEELRKQEAEKKRLKEQMARLEEERKRQEEELKKRQAEEERKKKEEEEERKRQEEKKKKEAEEERRRQEEAKRKEEEQQRKKEEAARKREEEKKRKEEEKERKRKLEEERKREEEERKRKQQEEEEARKKKEEEAAEQQRRAEQQKRQAEALRKLQEKQQQQRGKAAPWSQQAGAQPAGGSLVEIQRQEKKEKEAREREQQQAMLQLQQQQQLLLQQQQLQQQQQQVTAAEAAARGIQLKWAEKKPTGSGKVKSLSEIQAEEQEQLAKQLERERAERAQQQKEVPVAVSIWGTAAQSLTWASAATSNNATPAWGGAGTGNGTYWEETTPPPPPPVQKPAPSKNAGKTKNPAPAAGTGKGNGKTRSKKEEAVVMKLFEQTTQQQGDEFTQWCTRSLNSIQASVDIPTFVGFLRDIESPYDVKDYVRMYLGEEKEAQDFACQFLERRSKWRNSQRSNSQDDNMCNQMSSTNSNTISTDFQEVKGKKKAKKSKMFKVDNRILGFNVTAAQDRINVGDRDYGEGM